MLSTTAHCLHGLFLPLNSLLLSQLFTLSLLALLLGPLPLILILHPKPFKFSQALLLFLQFFLSGLLCEHLTLI